MSRTIAVQNGSEKAVPVTGAAARPAARVSHFRPGDGPGRPLACSGQRAVRARRERAVQADGGHAHAADPPARGLSGAAVRPRGGGLHCLPVTH
jgi:hypothetical protein